MQESFWWWQCSDWYIISLFPHLHTPFSPSLISLVVSVDVIHTMFTYLLTYLLEVFQGHIKTNSHINYIYAVIEQRWRNLTVPWVWPDARRGQKWEVPPPDTTPWSYLSPGPRPVPETRCRARTHRSSGACTPPRLLMNLREKQWNYCACVVSAWWLRQAF